MTLNQIQNQIVKLLKNELNIVADEFDVTFMADGSFNITLYTEDNKERDIGSMIAIRSYFLNLGAKIVSELDVYEDLEDGYIGTFIGIKK